MARVPIRRLFVGMTKAKQNAFRQVPAHELQAERQAAPGEAAGQGERGVADLDRTPEENPLTPDAVAKLFDLTEGRRWEGQAVRSVIDP